MRNLCGNDSECGRDKECRGRQGTRSAEVRVEVTSSTCFRDLTSWLPSWIRVKRGRPMCARRIRFATRHGNISSRLDALGSGRSGRLPVAQTGSRSGRCVRRRVLFQSRVSPSIRVCQRLLYATRSLSSQEGHIPDVLRRVNYW